MSDNKFPQKSFAMRLMDGGWQREAISVYFNFLTYISLSGGLLYVAIKLDSTVLWWIAIISAFMCGQYCFSFLDPPMMRMLQRMLSSEPTRASFQGWYFVMLMLSSGVTVGVALFVTSLAKAQ